MNHKTRTTKVLAFILCAVMLLSSMPLTALAARTPGVNVPEDRVYINSTAYSLIPGAQEIVLTTNNKAGTNQRIGYILNVSKDAYTSGAIKIAAAYKDYQYDQYGLQTVTDQAAAYEMAHPGEKVIAGINADFFNMTNGAPSGAFVMNGKICNEVNGYPYFAILKDGTAVIRTGAHTDLSDVYEAVAGNEIIVNEGQVTVGTSDYEITSYSRTAIGIKYDGTVISYVTHGISKPKSCGETYEDVAKVLISQGCQYALMLDGGGSSTYASKREGSDKLVVQNSPSDGTPRTVSDTLLFVSTALSDGKFDHASLLPNNAYYTPTKTAGNPTTVQFEAQGIDVSGSACELPAEGLLWRLDSESSEMGVINAETGMFTAAAGKTGTVGVELLLGEAVVGTTEIQISEPDELYFNGSALSLDFNASTDLGLNVRGNGVDLITKEGDFEWTLSSDRIGSVTNNIFTAAAKTNETLAGTVTVSYRKADGETLSSVISLEIGKMPVVALDFEDGDFNVGLYDWGCAGSYFTDGQQRTYKFDNTDAVYYLRRQYWNGSGWSNTGDSAWVENCYSATQPWTDNGDGTVTLTYIKGEADWDEATLTHGTKEAGYGNDGDIWVTYGDIPDAGGTRVRYAWTVYKEGSVFSSNYNGNRPAATLLAANGYDMYVWHASANPTDEVNNGLHGAGSKVISRDEGEVRFGEHSLKLTYDYRNFSPTGSTKNCNTYYRMTDPLIAEGSPTGLGMWVYAPEGMSNFWFWTRIFYWNGSAWTSSYIHYKPAGAEKTCQYTGINWTGWTYVEADLSAIYQAGAIVDEKHPVMIRDGESLILMTYIPGGTSDGEGHAIVCGSKSAGYFCIDNVRWVYGTNVDDMDSPQIISAKANSAVLTTEDVVTLDTNDITFAIDYTDPQGENYTGIDAEATQLFLDGAVLTSADFVASADRAQTVEKKLANGEHTLKVNVYDNFGNKTEQFYKFIVKNEKSDIPSINIIREEKVELGGDYNITISADDLSNIASVSTTIVYEDIQKFENRTVYMDGVNFYDDYGNTVHPAADGKYYDALGNYLEEPMRIAGTFPISNAVQRLGENMSGTIRNKTIIENNTTKRAFTSKATVKSDKTSDNTLLTFNFPIPRTLTEMDKVPYSVTVSYTTTSGETYFVTTGSTKAPLWAYYTIEPGIQVSGAANGTLTVKGSGENDSTADLKVYNDTQDITGQGSFDANGVFTTGYFTAQNAGTVNNSVWVGDDANKHYSFKSSVNVSRGAENDTPAFGISLNASTGDTETTENITWFGTAECKAEAVVQFMKTEEYTALMEQALAVEGATEESVKDTVFAAAETVTGTAKLTQFNADIVAAYINNVKLTGLEKGTSYTFRVGDGEKWSNTDVFTTSKGAGTTSFAVIADTQLLGNDTQDAEAIGILNKIGEELNGYDFGIQTGDYVDGGIEFNLWKQISGVWNESFNGIDFVHVMGNHENYGTDGSAISSAIFGLEDTERDYYSVEYGDVYVAVINQTADLVEAAKWLVEDAAKTDCTWKVMVDHQPVYFTNPGGSSQGHNLVLAPACDEAGIDFVFNGHDHSYARTEQMLGGTPVDLATDENTNAYVNSEGELEATKGMGTVYFICGDLGEKSRETGYKIVDNADFHFAKATQDYEAVYVTVEADNGKFAVNAWNLTSEGPVLLDTYTMYNEAGVCAATEHVITADAAVYDSAEGKLICERCGAALDPVEENYTGYAVDINGADENGDSRYYFLAGSIRTGFFAIEEDIFYATANGLIDESLYKSTDIPTTCLSRGHYVLTARDGASKQYNYAQAPGHEYEEQEDGSFVCSVCGYKRIEMSECLVVLPYEALSYTGAPVTQYPKVYAPDGSEMTGFSGTDDKLDRDFQVTCYDNVNVGIAKMTVKAYTGGFYVNINEYRSRYGGSVETTYVIRPDRPADLKVAVEGSTAKLSWTASKAEECCEITYQIQCSANGGASWKTLAETQDKEYTVTALNPNTSYQFRVRAKAVVDGVEYLSLNPHETVSADVLKCLDINDARIYVKNAVFTGEEITPVVTIKYDGELLTEGVDYILEVKDNVESGFGVVNVYGINDYFGFAYEGFYIAPQDITGTAAAVVENTEVDYSEEGAVNTFTVTGKNGIALVLDKDYTVAYENNDKVGTATAVITGIGNYTGTVSAEFTITEVEHIITFIPEVSATCTETGVKEYYKCILCDKMFKDEAASEEVSESELVLRPLRHVWSAFEYTWAEAADGFACTRVQHCLRDNCDAVTEEENGNVTFVATVPATCITTGEGVYTAVFTGEEGHEETKTVIIPAAGHLWTEPELKWVLTEKGYECTAKAVCTADGCEETVSETVMTTGKMVKKATCTADGIYKYTAEFTNKAFAKAEYEVVLSATGHMYADGSCSICGKLMAPVVKVSNAASTGYVKLTWKAVKGAVSYKVYRATSKTGTYKLMKTTTTCEYYNSNATAGKTYYYKVVAVAKDTTKNSVKSSAVNGICKLSAPVVTVSNVASTGNVKLTWAKVNGAVKYQVYRATSKTGTYKLMKTTTSLSYTNSNGAAGTKYFYKVKAVAADTNANSAFSSVKCRTFDYAQPVVKITLSSSGKPVLTWNAVNGAKEYKVYRATSATGTYKLMKTTTSLKYTNTSAVKGTTYFYKVRAVGSNVDANSAYSTVMSVKSK